MSLHSLEVEASRRSSFGVNLACDGYPHALDHGTMARRSPATAVGAGHSDMSRPSRCCAPPPSEARPSMLYLNGSTLCRLMRRHHVTIRLLAQRLAISMKRVRCCRQCGIEDRHVARDWLEAITGGIPACCMRRFA